MFFIFATSLSFGVFDQNIIKKNVLPFEDMSIEYFCIFNWKNNQINSKIQNYLI